MPPLLRRPGAWLLIGLGVVLLAGIAAFVLAFQPCRFSVPAGRELAWTLNVATAELGPDGRPGRPRSADYRIALVGLGPETGDAALVAGPLGGAPGQIELVSVASNAAIVRPGRDGRSEPGGAAVAGFDFALLPLPSGSEQEWHPEVVWSALPEAKRTVATTTKRTRSGARPEFRCEFPASVEWVEPTGRYRQVRGLVSTWRFDALRGVPLSAEVRFRVFDELPPPAQRRGREVVLTLAWQGSSPAGDPSRLRSAALAGAAAAGYVAGRRAPPAELLQQVRAGGGTFAGLADGLMARLGSMR